MIRGLLVLLLVTGSVCGQSGAADDGWDGWPAFQLNDAAPAVGGVVLAAEGRLPAVLQVGLDVAAQARESAEQLSSFVSRISGQTPTVVMLDAPAVAAGDATAPNAGAAHRIVFCLLDHGQPGLPASIAANPESFLIDVSDGWMRIAASSSEGFSNAVFGLLDTLGCRWFFADDVWEELPSGRTIRIAPGRVADAPDYLYRRIWYGYGVRGDDPARDYANWVRHNRMGGWLKGSTGHAYEGLVEPDTHFKDHPDWFPMIDGKRTPKGQLCLSNPDLRAFVTRRVLERFDRQPEMSMQSVSPNDGGGYCQCPECASRSITDNTVILANEVAAAVAGRYPRNYVAMYAYAGNSPPPTIEVRPNVLIFAAKGFIHGGYTFEQILNGWSAKAQRLGIREYFHVITWNANVIRWQVDAMARNIPAWHERGVFALSAESSNCWGAEGLNYYVAARLMWNTRADVQQILDDFYRRCWGPAEPAMRQFYDIVRRSSGYMGIGQLKLLTDALEEAGRLTPGGSRFERRVDMMKLYAHWLKLRLDAGTRRGDLELLKHMREVIRFTSEIENTNLVHSYAVYREDRIWPLPELIWRNKVFPGSDKWQAEVKPQPKDVADELALELEQGPDRLKSAIKPKVDQVPKFQILMSNWQPGPKEFTHAEVQALFEADRADLPQRVLMPSERTWSDDLTPLPSAPVSSDRPDSPRFRGQNTFRFHVSQGGPVKLLIHPVNGACQWKLYPAGTPDDVKAEGGVEQNEQPQTVEVVVDAAGLYGVDLRSGFCRFSVPDHPWVWVNQGTAHVISGTGRMYFFVPAGVDVLGLRVQTPDGSGSVAITDPSGKVVLSHQGNYKSGEQFAVEVQPGQAGVWSYRIGRSEDATGIRLLGVPPYATPDPGQLLVPRDALDSK